MILTMTALLMLAPQAATTFTRSAAPDPAVESVERQDKDRRNWDDTGKPSGPPKPVFLKTPTGEDVLAAYPSAAKLANDAGEAVVRCKIDKAGLLAGCKVVSETPKKAGFGEAAITLSKVFVLDTKASDGSSMVGQNLTLPMKFKP